MYNDAVGDDAIDDDDDVDDDAVGDAIDGYGGGGHYLCNTIVT